MTIRQRLATTVALAIASAAALVGLAPQPATAAPARYISIWDVWIRGCPAGYVCLSIGYENTDQAYGFYNDEWNLGTVPSPYRNINNRAKSAVNSGTGTYSYVRLYDQAGGTGANGCLRPGVWRNDLRHLTEKVSTLVWASSCGSTTPL